MTAQFASIAGALVILVTVLLLIRSYFLPEKYAVIWILAATSALVLAVFPELLVFISKFLGISDPINLLFLCGFIFVLLMLMQITLELAKTKDQLREATQKIAIALSDEEKFQD